MLKMSNPIGNSALSYVNAYGRDARVYLDSDIGVASANLDWSKVHYLRRTKLRLQRFELWLSSRRVQAAKTFAAA